METPAPSSPAASSPAAAPAAAAAPAPPRQRRLPWYSFLYRLLGPQGTFWLWLVTLGALWWTAKPAFVRFLNRHPSQVSVAAAGRADWRLSWVGLADVVELGLDRSLLLRSTPPTVPPVHVLVDREEPAARWWLETRDLCRLARPELGAVAALGGSLGAGPSLAKLSLMRRFAELEGGDAAHAIPAPERSLLVGGVDLPPLSAPPSPDPTGARPTGYQERLVARIELVCARVQPRAAVEGVLHQAPATLLARVADEANLQPAPVLIQVGQKPREVERVVFSAAVLTLVLLAAGLYGAAESASETA